MSTTDWNPGDKYRMYLDRIQGLLTDEERTVRDVYYALEARGFPDELAAQGYKFEYRYVKRAVKKGRRAGFIDPSLIIDASRIAETTADEGHDTPRSFLRKHVDGVWKAYRENFWRDQDCYVEVWLEKQSLASVFGPICDDYNVRLEATRGDWSDSKVYEATRRLDEKLSEDKDVKILYLGDFNPSGFHAPVSTQETMAHYGLGFNRDYGDESCHQFDIWPWDGPLPSETSDGSVEFDRLALNMDHIRRFDLPENPTPSSTDKDKTLKKRFMRCVSDGRDVNIELNALKEYERDFLETLLEDAIQQYVDEEKREETGKRVEDRREQLESAISVDWNAL
jgi:cation transport regulator ChaB